MGIFDAFRRRLTAPPPAGIEIHGDRFVLHDGAGARCEVRFDDIHEVFAFRRPQGATQFVCLGIQTEFEGEPVVVDEALPGYASLQELLLARFQIDAGDLQMRVMRGAPGPQPTRLWRKRGDTFKR
jgi:hypothetical protein